MRLALFCLALLMTGSVANAEQFSIRCSRAGWHHFTFDDGTKRVVSRAPGGGTVQRGYLDSVSDEEIHFHLFQDYERKFDFVLDWKTREVIVKGSGQTTAWFCERTELQVGDLPLFEQVYPYYSEMKR